MPTATLTSKGQTTIPKEIRNHLHLHPGDRLEFVIDESGRVVLLPATVDAAQLKGILPPPKRPVTVEAMRQVIRKRGGRL
jgi:AbrB family looped-hinge helix DNA binding protein